MEVWRFGGVLATVGANRGKEDQFFQIGRFDRSGSVYRGLSGSSGVDYLDNKSFCLFNAGSANIPLLPLAFLEMA
jgi:hypothetical protein